MNGCIPAPHRAAGRARVGRSPPPPQPGLQVRRHDLPMVVQDQQAPAERFEQRSDDWTLGKGGDLRLKQFWGGARKWDGHVHRRDVRRIEHAAGEYHGPSRPVMTHLRTERSSEWRSCSPSTRSGPRERGAKVSTTHCSQPIIDMVTQDANGTSANLAAQRPDSDFPLLPGRPCGAPAPPRACGVSCPSGVGGS